MGALKNTYGELRSEPLALCAVKSNLGHLEGAAGMAGLVKAWAIFFFGIFLECLFVSCFFCVCLAVCEFVCLVAWLFACPLTRSLASFSLDYSVWRCVCLFELEIMFSFLK